MYSLEATNRYLKDLDLAKRRNLDITELNKIIKMLVEGKKLPIKNKDHALTGKLKGIRDCHIAPDWILLYEKNETIQLIRLIRTGTHADLFKK